MAIRIELSLNTTKDALEKHLQSLKRAEKSTNNQLIAEIIRKDIAELSRAMNTLTEIK